MDSDVTESPITRNMLELAATPLATVDVDVDTTRDHFLALSG